MVITPLLCPRPPGWQRPARYPRTSWHREALRRSSPSGPTPPSWVRWPCRVQHACPWGGAWSSLPCTKDNSRSNEHGGGRCPFLIQVAACGYARQGLPAVDFSCLTTHMASDQVSVMISDRYASLGSSRCPFSRSAAKAMHARMSSSVRYGKSSKISVIVMPPAKYSNTSSTVMRIPRIHG